MEAASLVKYLLSNAWCLLPICVASAMSQAGAKWYRPSQWHWQPLPARQHARKHGGGHRQQELTMHLSPNPSTPIGVMFHALA